MAELLKSQKELKESQEEIFFNKLLKEIFENSKTILTSCSLKTFVDGLNDQVLNKTNIHFTFTCNGCSAKHFEGARYSCNDCVGFHYCQTCYDSYVAIHNHGFNCIKEPEVYSQASLDLFRIICKHRETLREFEKAKDEVTNINTDELLRNEQSFLLKDNDYKAQLEYILRDLGFDQSTLTAEQIHSVLVSCDGNIDESLSILINTQKE